MDCTHVTQLWTTRDNPDNTAANQEGEGRDGVETNMERKEDVERVYLRDAANANCQPLELERSTLIRQVQNPNHQATVSAQVQAWSTCLSHEREERLVQSCTQHVRGLTDRENAMGHHVVFRGSSRTA